MGAQVPLTTACPAAALGDQVPGPGSDLCSILA